MEAFPLSFLQEAQESFEQILNERKAILRPEIKKKTIKKVLKSLLFHLKGSEVETLESRDYESFLEAQKILLNISLIYNNLEDEPVKIIDTQDNNNINTETQENAHSTDGQENATSVQVLENDSITESAENNTMTIENFEDDLINDPFITTDDLDITVILYELERLINLLDKGPVDDSNMIKNITISRRLKLQIFILAFLCQSQTGEIPTIFEQMAVTFSHEDIFASLNKILPRAFNYNFYMKYYATFLQKFVMSIKIEKFKNLMASELESFNNQFPKFQLSFEVRHEMVMKKLGMESFNLEDCCDRIETRASVMAFESPIEIARKMFHLWLLMDASEFLTFDDNFMTIYVFSSDLSVYHEQFMRIFYILNRIDEVVREIGYSAYITPKFVDYYKTVYTEMHLIFSKLIHALSKNYEIYEMESDPISGVIKKKREASVFIAAKLKELVIHLTCPLACLDSILRLSLDVTDIPILFGEEEEKFIFNTQVQSILVLHDFVASDREKFAEHLVELYPCLDRHFSRFHKSKKMESQGLNTALPPSYHLFASKPPTYENINDSDLDLEMQDNGDERNECFLNCCKTYVPAAFFIIITVITLFFALNS